VTVVPATTLAAAARPGWRAPAPGRLWRLALADVRERMRRPGFVIALIVMAWLVHGMLPEASAGYRTFAMKNEWRPAYGPEWVGTLVGSMCGLWFVLVGFFQVKGAVERDRVTGVGPILAASRVGRLRYVLAKVLSNALVFTAMLGVALAVALVTQQLLGEDHTFAPLATAVPLFALALPVAIVVAAFAVLFECIPGLGGGFGNIAWFVLSMAALASGIVDSERGAPRTSDLLGFSAVAHSTYEALHAIHPEIVINTKDISMGVNVSAEWAGRPQPTFPWHGLAWDAAALAARLTWLLVALAASVLASLVFDRFQRPVRAPAHRLPRAPAWLRPRALAAPVHALHATAATLPPATRGRAFAGLLRAELALLLHGRPLVWWLGGAGLVIATAFAPLPAVRSALLPILSVWPLLVLGAIGARMHMHGTEGMLLSAPRPVLRSLAAAWLAGALLLLALGAVAMLRFSLGGHADAAAGWLLGSALLSAFALASGMWTGGTKLFEVLLLFAWYIGPMHHLPELDYTGVTAARSPVLWLAYGAILVALLVLATIGRTRQLRR
jgi:hypothetical protein